MLIMMTMMGEENCCVVDRIGDFYGGRTVLITGATGFLGKVLLEKMLRACGGVKKIYLLVRSKNEKEPFLRLKDLFNDPIFTALKSQTSDLEIFNKIEAISADMTHYDLALSDQSKQRIFNEVEIIFHCAANVKFDTPLRQAVITNVRGTKLMLQLASQCIKLIAFCHVSTAYCHLNEEILLEKTYPPPQNPHNVIKICEYLHSDLIEKIKYDILDHFPNSYPFTKALSEGLVNEVMEKIPVFIVRPSVITPIWKEPLPGYTDNINGPTGVLIGAGKGVIRTLYCKEDGYLDYIPADIAANALLFSAYDFVTSKGERCVYNAVSSSEYKVTFMEVVKVAKTVIECNLPFNNVFWYPGGALTQSKLKHYFVLILFQLLPALLVDGVLVLCRLKPFMMKIQKRTLNAYKMFEYYINRNWNFDNHDSLTAIEQLNAKEREIYKLDARNGILRDYFIHCIHSARLYILKEEDDQIPKAKRQMKMMWLLDLVCKIILTGTLLYYMTSYYFKN